jgi:4-hydroxybenzoyl-CoA reductase subunit alpha
VKRDVTIVALKNECYLEGGAYSSFGIATIYYAGSLLGGPYRLQNMKYDAYRVHTNKPACGAQRGHGGVIARAAWEQQLDRIAEEIGMDPVEFRLKNMMEAGDVSCNDLKMNSLGMRECIEAVRDGSGWKEKKGRLPKGKGIGMACGFFVSGAGFPIYRSDTYHATVSIHVSEDGGTVHVFTASAEIGQGSDTAFAMIAAETIGIPLDSVRISSGDTEFGIDLGAFQPPNIDDGHATKEAAVDVRRQILGVLARELKVDISELDIKDGLMFQHGKSGLRQYQARTSRHRGWEGLARAGSSTFQRLPGSPISPEGTIIGKANTNLANSGHSQGRRGRHSPAYGCSAQVVEVSVDGDRKNHRGKDDGRPRLRVRHQPDLRRGPNAGLSFHGYG